MFLLQAVACFHSLPPYRQVNGVPAIQGSPEAGKKKMGLWLHAVLCLTMKAFKQKGFFHIVHFVIEADLLLKWPDLFHSWTQFG